MDLVELNGKDGSFVILLKYWINKDRIVYHRGKCLYENNIKDVFGAVSKEELILSKQEGGKKN